jgi:hypothetical protein
MSDFESAFGSRSRRQTVGPQRLLRPRADVATEVLPTSLGGGATLQGKLRRELVAVQLCALRMIV